MSNTSQLATLLILLPSHHPFRNGQLNIWVVVEIYHPDPHGSESDFGLVPGGRVKLVKSTTIDVCKPSPRSVVIAAVSSFHSNALSRFHSIPMLCPDSIPFQCSVQIPFHLSSHSIPISPFQVTICCGCHTGSLSAVSSNGYQSPVHWHRYSELRLSSLF